MRQRFIATRHTPLPKDRRHSPENAGTESMVYDPSDDDRPAPNSMPRAGALPLIPSGHETAVDGSTFGAARCRPGTVQAGQA